jgi:hypothetical protein
MVMFRYPARITSAHTTPMDWLPDKLISSAQLFVSSAIADSWRTVKPKGKVQFSSLRKAHKAIICLLS